MASLRDLKPKLIEDKSKPDAPFIDAALIAFLEYCYRDQYQTDLSISDRQLWFKAGQIDVVRMLKNLQETQLHPR